MTRVEVSSVQRVKDNTGGTHRLQQGGVMDQTQVPNAPGPTHSQAH